MTIRELFSKAKSVFTEPDDQQYLEQQQDYLSDLEDIASLMDDPRAEALKRVVKSDLETYIRQMCDSNDPTKIADVRATLKILDKLTANKELESVRIWLEEKLTDES